MDHKAEQEIIASEVMYHYMNEEEIDDTVRLLEIEIEALDQAIERVSEYAITTMGARHERLLRRLRDKLIAKLHKEVNEWYRHQLEEDARLEPIWEWLDRENPEV